MRLCNYPLEFRLSRSLRFCLNLLQRMSDRMVQEQKQFEEHMKMFEDQDCAGQAACFSLVSISNGCLAGHMQLIIYRHTSLTVTS
jgi:hypothetical protein